MPRSFEEYQAQLQETAEPTPETVTASDEPEASAPETEPPATESADPKDSALPEPEAETPKESKGTKEKFADAGIEISDVYTWEVPGMDGTTFGELKDLGPDVQDVSRLKLEVQQQRDELLTKQTEYGNQVNATIGRLVEALGEDKVLAALEQAPADVEAARQRRDTELQMFRPELAEPTKMAEADAKVAELATFYRLQPAAFKSADAGLTRAFLRLHELESYLDTLRKPEQPKKQVRSTGKKAGAARGKSKRRFDSDQLQAFADKVAARSTN